MIEEPVFPFFVAAFVTGCCTAIAGWFLGIAELIAVHRLQPWVFTIGSVAVLTSRQAHCPPRLAIPGPCETSSLKYVVLDGGRCLFRRKLQFRGSRWQTPLELKGQLYWGDENLVATGRYPIGVLVFFLGWLVAWSSFGLIFIIKGDLVGLPFWLVGWLFAGGSILYSGWLGRRRFLANLVELETVLCTEPLVRQ
jgi:hypothetical protein